MFLRYMAFLTGLLLVWPAFSAEIFSLIGEDCKVHSGMIIHVSPMEVELLNLEGRFQIVPREQVKSILVFNTVINPIPRLYIDEKMQSRMREVRLVEGGGSTFAFPLRTLEKLVVFFDLNGGIRVHDLHEIKTLRPVQGLVGKTQKIAKFEPLNLDFASASSLCSLPSNPKGVKPSRLLRDQIQVQELLEDLYEGYEAINSFMERTYLYARPILYKDESRLGFTSVKDRLEYPNLFNMYFQWSGGEAYRFQSFNVIGAKTFEHVPNVEPVFAFRSDVKSHLFHGVLIANFSGISAGQPVFSDTVWTDISDPSAFHYSFNYLGLLGVDYGQWTFSVGYFFPSFLIVAGTEAREILARQASYVARVMMTTDRFKLRMIGTTNTYDRNQPSKKDMEFQDDDGVELARPSQFEFNYVFLRGGLDADLTELLTTSLDLVYIEGDYRETLSGIDQKFDFRRTVISAQAKLQFGDYTAVGLRLNQMKVNENYKFTQIHKTEDEWRTSLIGEFEFVF